MKKWWILITIAGAIVSQALTPLFWHFPSDPMPTHAQLPFFIFLSLLESVTFGIGIAFFLFGKKYVDQATDHSKKLAWAVYLSIGWLLVSWWPHDNFHRANGMNLQGLLYIEYAFHVTLIISAFILAYAYFHPLKTTKN